MILFCSYKRDRYASCIGELSLQLRCAILIIFCGLLESTGVYFW